MKLFKMSKEKVNAVSYEINHNELDLNNLEILVLGACCQKSTDSFHNVQEAVNALNIDYTVLNIGDPVVIAQYGVMRTPALVVNNKVMSMGKLIKVDEAKFLIQKALSSEVQ